MDVVYQFDSELTEHIPYRHREDVRLALNKFHTGSEHLSREQLVPDALREAYCRTQESRRVPVRVRVYEDGSFTFEEICVLRGGEGA